VTVELSAPEHVTADFVGEPGDRTFYVQAIERGEEVSILVEKQQVASLAEVLRRLLAEVGGEPPTLWDIDSMRLREPITPRWRGGELAVGIDPQLGRFVIEVDELVEPGTDEPERVRIWLDEDRAAVLAAHAEWAVEQGRPSCRVCGLPMDPTGHLCPRTNGDPRSR
jgi:uncharacterized repeat protein (TIGR03847 family)